MSLFMEAAARARAFLLKPPAAARVESGRTHSPVDVVVIGLSAGCGATTLARGLALSLSSETGVDARVLTLPDDVGANSGSVPWTGGRSRVWDAGASDGAMARGLARSADSVLLVAGKSAEPALAEVAAALIDEDLGRVVLVANRVTDVSRWEGRCDLCVPEAWLGAVLVRRGRRPPGAFGAALSRLACAVAAGDGATARQPAG